MVVRDPRQVRSLFIMVSVPPRSSDGSQQSHALDDARGEDSYRACKYQPERDDEEW